MKAERHLVLGAARSGKTRHALDLAASLKRARSESEVVYVATAEARDAEMQDRIMRHRQERPPQWKTLEAPRELGLALESLPASAIVVVDCLTLWLSNAMLRDFDEASPTGELPSWFSEREAFMKYLASSAHTIMLVSNEVGAGIVPMAPIARRFQSEQGCLNQAVASVCERVTLVVAGIPLGIKPTARSTGC
jgi:adenosylcobinamide kinase / adenosylcobinamide-phosphate guanylyltransferase